jgi:hypothetical protein
MRTPLRGETPPAARAVADGAFRKCRTDARRQSTRGGRGMQASLDKTVPRSLGRSTKASPAEPSESDTGRSRQHPPMSLEPAIQERGASSLAAAQQPHRDLERAEGDALAHGTQSRQGHRDDEHHRRCGCAEQSAHPEGESRLRNKEGRVGTTGVGRTNRRDHLARRPETRADPYGHRRHSQGNGEEARHSEMLAPLGSASDVPNHRQLG